MEAPEKIYLSRNALGVFCNSWWLEPDKSLDNVEYIRKDAFIEKAEKWLSLNIKMLMNVLDVEYDTHEIDIKDFVEDFKRYMEE